MKALVFGDPSGFPQNLIPTLTGKSFEVESVTDQLAAQQALCSMEGTCVAICEFTEETGSFLRWARNHSNKAIKETHFTFIVNAHRPQMDEVQERLGAAFVTASQWYNRGIANLGNLEAVG